MFIMNFDNHNLKQVEGVYGNAINSIVILLFIKSNRIRELKLIEISKKITLILNNFSSFTDINNI